MLRRSHSSDDLAALVIGAGGGGGGIVGAESSGSAPGGNGGIAIAGSGVQNAIGSGRPGKAPNTQGYGGRPPGYGSNPFDGAQNVTGGFAARLGGTNDEASGGGPVALGGGGDNFSYVASWLQNTSTLSLPQPGEGQQGCGGGQPRWAGGAGGGHAGGGGGVSAETETVYAMAYQNFFGAGAAGGSSWAAGAGAGVTLPATLDGWQVLVEDSSQVAVTVHCKDCGTPLPVHVSTIGDGFPNNVSFTSLEDVAWDDSNQRILVLDGDQVKVFEVVNNETISFQFAFGGTGSANGMFNAPAGIAWDDTNKRILVADSGNRRVQIFDQQGRFLSAIGSSVLRNPTSVAWDATHQEIVVGDEDPATNAIYFFDAAGKPFSPFPVPDNGIPSGVVWDGDTGYITDVANKVVWKCTDNQGCSSLGQSGNGVGGTFSFPIGIHWDSENDRLFVGNDASTTGTTTSAQLLDQNGAFLYTFPNSVPSISLSSVFGVAWAAAPSWYLIADNGNNVIQVYFQPDS